MKGSLAEIQIQLEIAYKIEYLNKQILSDLEERCQIIGKMIGS